MNKVKHLPAGVSKLTWRLASSCLSSAGWACKYLRSVVCGAVLGGQCMISDQGSVWSVVNTLRSAIGGASGTAVQVESSSSAGGIFHSASSSAGWYTPLLPAPSYPPPIHILRDRPDKVWSMNGRRRYDLASGM